MKLLANRYGIWIGLFVLALTPRLPGLGRFLTSDENTNIFIAGSDVMAAFLRGDLRGTYWHFYPGVTMSWLDAFGLGGQYLLAWLRGAPLPPFTEYIYSDILTLVIAARLPYALLTALAVPVVYVLARHLFPDPVALVGALCMAFDPFFLAHSRVAHGDAPVAVFMVVSILALLGYAQRTDRHLWRDPYLITSAVSGSLAALTKAPGQLMAVLVIGFAVMYAVIDGYAQKQSLRDSLKHWAQVVLAWGVISLAVFILVWPGMWVDPFGTLRQMLNETFGKVEEGHLVYFFGQPTLDPGPWFYLYVIPFRLTPVTLLGAGLSLLLLTWHAVTDPKLFKWHALLWLIVIVLVLLANLSPKKQDRYLLPLFPMLSLLAAIGWVGVVSWLSRYKLPVLALVVGVHFIPTVTYYPYYLTYFNPLMGGPTRASETTLMGWGEGMEQVAAYLNAKPNAADLYVASTPSQTLLPYFAGTGENFYTNDIAFRADYVVLYLAQRQRLAPSPEIVRYFQSQPPEHTVEIHGVEYAHIYPTEKRILAEMPPDATPLNVGVGEVMRLAGYDLTTTELRLYWHALAPIERNYTVSFRARAADDTLLHQHDRWPVEGLVPTSLWRVNDYVVDAYQWNASPEVAYFEVVVYHQPSGETPGAPITIAATYP